MAMAVAVGSMVEMLTRPSPCLRLFQQPPSDSGDWKQAEFVIGNTPHCPPVIPRLPPSVGKLRTVLYQPFTATFLIQPVSEISRYRYTGISGYIGYIRRVPALAFAQECKTQGAILFISEDMNSIGYSESWTFGYFERDIVKLGIFTAPNVSKLNRRRPQTIRISRHFERQLTKVPQFLSY